MTDNNAPRATSEQHRWSYDMRRWVLIGLVVAGVCVLYWIRETLPIFVLALLVAYLLNPLVALLHRRFRVSRLFATALIYLGLLAILVTTPALLLPTLVRQVGTLVSQLDDIVVQISNSLQRVPLFAVLGVNPDAHVVAEQIRLELAALTHQAPMFLIGAASRVFNLLVILVLSFYLLKDADSFERQLDTAVPAAYRADAERIKTELVEIWSGFLRGQILLALIIGAVTALALSALGVSNALLLGLLAGILEVVPTIGPIIAAVPAVLVAFFQGSSLWTIDRSVFALVVAGTYVVIQQLENHLVVPSVLGRSVNLPAVVVLFGALAGASLAGILGVFLAAPVLATTRLLMQFMLRKLFEPLPLTDRR